MNDDTWTVASFPGDDSGLEPPESISNSEVKQTCANDSVGLPHVKVGHRQGFIVIGWATAQQSILVNF